MACFCRVEIPDLFLVMFWREAPRAHLGLFHRNSLELLCRTDIFLARKRLCARSRLNSPTTIFAWLSARLTLAPGLTCLVSFSFPIPLGCMTYGHEGKVALSPARSSFVCCTSNGEARILSTLKKWTAAWNSKLGL